MVFASALLSPANFMNEDELDLSDEAYWDWDQQFNRLHMDKSFSEHGLDGWREARRRALLRYADVMNCWNESIDQKNREIDKLRAENERLRGLLGR